MITKQALSDSIQSYNPGLWRKLLHLWLSYSKPMKDLENFTKSLKDNEALSFAQIRELLRILDSEKNVESEIYRVFQKIKEEQLTYANPLGQWLHERVESGLTLLEMPVNFARAIPLGQWLHERVESGLTLLEMPVNFARAIWLGSYYMKRSQSILNVFCELGSSFSFMRAAYVTHTLASCFFMLSLYLAELSTLWAYFFASQSCRFLSAQLSCGTQQPTSIPGLKYFGKWIWPVILILGFDFLSGSSGQLILFCMAGEIIKFLTHSMQEKVVQLASLRFFAQRPNCSLLLKTILADLAFAAGGVAVSILYSFFINALKNEIPEPSSDQDTSSSKERPSNSQQKTSQQEFCNVLSLPKAERTLLEDARHCKQHPVACHRVARTVFGLNVEDASSKKQISRAYRKQSLFCHPDKIGDSSLQILLNNAREILDSKVRYSS